MTTMDTIKHVDMGTEETKCIERVSDIPRIEKHPLEGYIYDGELSKLEYGQLSRLGYDAYSNLIELMTSVNDIASNPAYIKMFSLYRVNIAGESIAERYTDVEGIEKGMFHTTLQSDGAHIYLHTYNPMIMAGFIENNSEKSHIFIPIMASVEADNSVTGHALAIYYDVKTKFAYLMDPNGRTGYYDDALIKIANTKSGLHIPDEIINDMYINGSEKVDMLMRRYISDLNEHLTGKEKYVYVSSTIWNSLDIPLNRSIPGAINNGHCMMFTLMLIHCISLTGKSLIDVYRDLVLKPDTQLGKMINGYSLYIHSMVSVLGHKLDMPPENDLTNW
jgi:hypothetical protein